MRSALRFRRAASRGGLSIWAAVLFVVATSLTAAHLYVLPKPARADIALPRALAALRSADDQNHWLAVHVLYAQCRCSQRILEHLAASGRPAATREKLLLVGSRQDVQASVTAIEARGIEVVQTTPSELRDRFHIEAAPLLVVADAGGAIRYVGGYSQHKQGLDLRDRQIIDGLIAQRPIRELPLFGCAVSKRLRELLDPLALRAPSNR